MAENRVRKEVTNMPRGNRTGPPIKSRGPRDGRGGGNPGRPGPGAGSRTGGRRGPCK